MPEVRRIVAYVPDLMDRSRFSALPGDVQVTFVGVPAELEGAFTSGSGVDLVVIDLGRAGVMDVMSGFTVLGGVRSIGFMSHVEREAMEQARQMGIGEVLPRSRFFARLLDVLAG